MQFLICLVCIALFSFATDARGQVDSLRRSSWTFDGFVSVTSLTNINWNNLDYSSVNMAVALDVGNRKTSASLTRKMDFRAELAYQKFIDSIWVKTADRFYVSTQWLFGKRHLKKAILFSCKSQLTDTWESSYKNPELLEWISGPMTPATLNAGAGFSYDVKKNINLSLTLAGIQVRSMPEPRYLLKRYKVLSDNKYALVQYRLSTGIEWTIDRHINEWMRWKCKGTILTSTLDASNADVDIQQSLSINPAKHFRISVEQKAMYDSFVSSRLQMRIEMRIGCYWGRE